MIHFPKPNDLDSRFTDVFDALMRFQRDGIQCTGLRLKTRSYLWTAYGLGIDEPDAPLRAVVGSIPLGRVVSFMNAAPLMGKVNLDVRVGPKFTINMGGDWLVTITEDTEP